MNDKLLQYLNTIAPQSVERIAQHLAGEEIEPPLTTDEKIDLQLAMDTASAALQDEIVADQMEIAHGIFKDSGGNIRLTELTKALATATGQSVEAAVTKFDFNGFCERFNLRTTSTNDRVFVSRIQ